VGKRLLVERVREILIAAVEQRVGAVAAFPEGYKLEFWTDNSGAHMAHNTKRIARSLRLTSSQYVGLLALKQPPRAKSFVNSFRRD
jgi:hypothetical protein